MAAIRKRTWTASDGTQKQAWLVDYRDQAGKRRAKQFARKKDADAFVTKASWEVSQGTHTADSQSITVEKAGQNWIERAEREALEPSTIKSYREHLRLHINPLLGAKRLNQLTKPMVEEYRDQLLDGGHSRIMAAKVLRSLSSLLKEAQRVGYVGQNVAHGITVKRSGRDKAKVVPPTKEHMRALIEAAGAETARPIDKPLLLVLLFAGLRASEIRALTWSNVDLKRGTITVDRRADPANLIGPPKSASGFRTIPVPVSVVSELKRWKLRCPASRLDLVFPSAAGTPIFHNNLVLSFQEPLQLAAGISRPKLVDGKPVKDEQGQTVREGLYSLHDFRHAAASLWIEQKVAPKRVQAWMGHASIALTFDVYGHLFAAQEEDAAVMAALEAGVLGAGGSAA
ncbi:tyrosine-type recombinase/integrase [Novosphingobium sp. 9U]|uniref:tyrosine-type recombinase/integrase n=1 Tax=Novosphingobium sp. 9U TaxID=2653158 RepID=UPI0012F372EA|nr:tyrosine-type recombinase/integrase [Novosphingobium sp. 9U]VWX52978.1 Site-specific integrase [Novosphingobium sp. 9U]